jgi:hypothetical protein
MIQAAVGRRRGIAGFAGIEDLLRGHRDRADGMQVREDFAIVAPRAGERADVAAFVRWLQDEAAREKTR